MPTLREHVADAIQRDQSAGGAGILSPEDVAAVEWALMAAMRLAAKGDAEAMQHRDTLAVLLADLGPRRMLVHGQTSRVDEYYMTCADVVISAYDAWFDERAKARG